MCAQILRYLESKHLSFFSAQWVSRCAGAGVGLAGYAVRSRSWGFGGGWFTPIFALR